MPVSQPYFLHAARVSITHASFTAAAASETINLMTIPARAQVVGVVCVVTETPDDDDGDLTAWSLEVGHDSGGGDVDAFLTSHDYIADGAGVVESTCGAALTTEQGLISSTASCNLTCTATVVGVTLNDAGIDAGGWTFYVHYIQFPS